MLLVGCIRLLQSAKFNTVVMTTVRSLSQPVKERISFPSENKAGTGEGVVQGDFNQTKKGLIVLQEWWGVNEQIQEIAGRIGQQGNFVTLVPDLYRGKMTEDAEEAGHFMGNLNWQGAVQDIAGAAKFLLSKGCLKVGVTGFCMGGALTLASAVLVPEVSAGAPFYGIPGTMLADVSKIKIPIQCHFGELDDIVGFSSPKDYEALRQKLKDGNVSFEFYTYPTGHAFNNPTNPNYNLEISNTALGRTIEFMNKHLS